MTDIITRYDLVRLDQYGHPATGIPHITKFSIVINKDETISADFPLNPSLDMFLKICKGFIKRVELGVINQRKE